MSDDPWPLPTCVRADPNAVPQPGDKYVSPRVYDVPVPCVPSLKRHCGSCGAQVWVDVRTIHLADALPIFCDHCALAEMLVGAEE